MPQIVYYGIVIIAMLLLLRIMTAPVRLLWKLLLNAACGWALLLLFNLCTGLTGFAMPVSFLSAVIVGFLGLPGFGFLLILRTLAL